MVLLGSQAICVALIIFMDACISFMMAQSSKIANLVSKNLNMDCASFLLCIFKDLHKVDFENLQSDTPFFANL